MSKEINKDIRTDAVVRFPCRNQETGQLCWCTKNSMKCRARGVKIRNFAGEKYSNFGGPLWKTAKWGLIAIIVLAVVGKGIKVYKEAKSV